MDTGREKGFVLSMAIGVLFCWTQKRGLCMGGIGIGEEAAWIPRLAWHCIVRRLLFFWRFWFRAEALDRPGINCLRT